MAKQSRSRIKPIIKRNVTQEPVVPRECEAADNPTTDPREHAKTILEAIIKRNTAIEEELYAEAQDKGLIINGKLNSNLSKEFLKFQAATLKATKEFVILDGKIEAKVEIDADPFEDIFSDA